MLKLRSDVLKVKVGDTVQCGLIRYIVVSIFEDNGRTFYVCKYTKKNDNVTSYSNILTYNKEHKLFKHV